MGCIFFVVAIIVATKIGLNYLTEQTYLNPERSSDNGTLDTFLHRIRLEIMNEHKHKQNRTDNLTKKQRGALNELISNPTLIINKANKVSTIAIVVQDRQDYTSEAMKHLNDPQTYKKLHENITTKLKEIIINQTHQTIKFTHEISDAELTFLDVTVYKGDQFQETNILDIKTHIKATNKQLYVHATSYHHPPSIIKAISKRETK